MRAQITAAWSRLCLGTGRLLYGIEDALDSATGWGALGRIAGGVAGVLFADAVIMRAPGLIYVVPLVWLFAAWRMSDSSATPPLSDSESSVDVFADQTYEIDRIERGPEGVMCTIHAVRGEVNEP